jgi:hypothetical protein
VLILRIAIKEFVSFPGKVVRGGGAGTRIWCSDGFLAKVKPLKGRVLTTNVYGLKCRAPQNREQVTRAGIEIWVEDINRGEGKS